jgi:CheY-like chemotaxis protein
MREQYAYDLVRVGGHETRAAPSGAEALQIVEREPIDCVILDLEMPGVDGFEVLHRQAGAERTRGARGRERHASLLKVVKRHGIRRG